MKWIEIVLATIIVVGSLTAMAVAIATSMKQWPWEDKS